MPTPNSPKPPSKRTLKGAILWCARWMLGDGAFYDGKVLVEISAAEEGETIRVRPVRGLDGLADPEPLTPAGRQQATPAELLAVLFSRDEERILSEMLGEAAVKAKNVLDAVNAKAGPAKLADNKFWTLWSNLQQRCIVTDADEGEGFVIGPAWVRELVRARSGGGKTAA